MKTCKTCVFWKCDDSGTRESWRAMSGVCTSEKLFESGVGDYAPDVLVYSYNEDGNFRTGPDFGCVHHQEEGHG